MARLKRYCPSGLPQHVIQRGINRCACFAAHQDMTTYAHYLHEAAQLHGVAVHSWVFMTNHVHLLVTPLEDESLSRTMQALGRRYVRYFNHRYQRTGGLFEGRFKSCLIDEEPYLLRCMRYIELNPVRAGMVSDPAEYLWSSYQAHALGRKPKLWQPHPLYLSLGKTNAVRQANYRSLVALGLESDLVKDIRLAVNSGLALGSDQFIAEIESQGGRRQHALKPGPSSQRPGSE